ncbi:MAG: sugar transferase [Ruminococcus sp.]|jgi:lipopolysaccharide/colanic/teichoic acid biosynthesis glycosyltransferase|nr:sugar transferase [Ruminococcus sp.]MDO4882351.1 sugar transferase [Oscillospiraceae bacterium]
MRAFEKLPAQFQNDSVKAYYDILSKRQGSIILKRVFDIIVSLILLVFLIIPIAVISILIKVNSPGPVLFKQKRVTTYGRIFKIYKFRTMVVNAESLGSKVTTKNDARVTSIGKTLRKFRLDELPQIFNVIGGSMSFVGTRPEVQKYVDLYEDEYYATLLLPAGITSLTSIKFKDEENLLSAIVDTEKIDETYVKTILPQKMEYNLQYTKEFGFLSDIKIMFKTVKEVIS